MTTEEREEQIQLAESEKLGFVANQQKNHLYLERIRRIRLKRKQFAKMRAGCSIIARSLKIYPYPWMKEDRLIYVRESIRLNLKRWR